MADDFARVLAHRWKSRAEDVPRFYQNTLDPDSPVSGPVLADLAIFCGAFETCYSSKDPYETAFKAGRQSAWLYILKMLQTDPLVLAEQLQEIVNGVRRSSHYQTTQDDGNRSDGARFGLEED